jgi:hypothetical protein
MSQAVIKGQAYEELGNLSSLDAAYKALLAKDVKIEDAIAAAKQAVVAQKAQVQIYRTQLGQDTSYVSSLRQTVKNLNESYTSLQAGLNASAKAFERGVKKFESEQIGLAVVSFLAAIGSAVAGVVTGGLSLSAMGAGSLTGLAKIFEDIEKLAALVEKIGQLFAQLQVIFAVGWAKDHRPGNLTACRLNLRLRVFPGNQHPPQRN